MISRLALRVAGSFATRAAACILVGRSGGRPSGLLGAPGDTTRGHASLSGYRLPGLLLLRDWLESPGAGPARRRLIAFVARFFCTLTGHLVIGVLHSPDVSFQPLNGVPKGACCDIAAGHS